MNGFSVTLSSKWLSSYHQLSNYVQKSEIIMYSRCINKPNEMIQALVEESHISFHSIFPFCFV